MSDFDNRRSKFTQSTIDTTLGTNAQKLYYVFTQELNNIKANYDLLDELLDINFCSGNLLNNLAALVGTSRINGETDLELRKKIITTALSKNSNGTAMDITSIVKAFDSINDYELEENPISDTLLWDSKTTLDGFEFIGLIHPATFRIKREVEDVDIVSYTLTDFISNAKASGVNGSYSLFIDITQAVHNFEPPETWDGLSILDGNTIMNENEIYNNERWDGETILDGNGYFTQAIGRYSVNQYKIIDTLGEVVKHEIHKDRFLNGIYCYSALLREAEGNGKYIKKIQFLTDSVVNFEVELNTGILKKQSIRLLFFERNL